jgi:hypothetical protein
LNQGSTDVTPEERDLIAGLFERMRGMGSIDKDREAEDFIARSVRQTPDAAYMLVQSVLVQENALQQAGDRIEELEDRVRELERSQPRAAQGGGSFLGGLFGGGGNRDEPRSGSVPPIGSRREDSRYDEPRGGGSPWGQRAGAFGQGGAPMQQQGGGGGFLRGAVATAAGVAGGMLLANSIRGMMGGEESGKAHASESGNKSSEEHSPYEVNQNQQKEQEPHYQDANDNYPGNYDSGDSSWGVGGGDIDI